MNLNSTPNSQQSMASSGYGSLSASQLQFDGDVSPEKFASPKNPPPSQKTSLQHSNKRVAGKPESLVATKLGEKDEVSLTFYIF